jgi:hypothetical protein
MIIIIHINKNIENKLKIKMLFKLNNKVIILNFLPLKKTLFKFQIKNCHNKHPKKSFQTFLT